MNESSVFWLVFPNLRFSRQIYLLALPNSGTAVDTASAAQNCVPRDYGRGSFVCVCNKTHCDSIDRLPVTDSKQVQVTESNRQGLRFQRSSIIVNKPTPGPRSVRIHIDRNSTFQKILGFGGAFTDAHGISATSLDPALTQMILNNYFSKDGLEYSMGRIVIGGCDFSLRKYTYDDDHDGDFGLEHFNLTAEDYQYIVGTGLGLWFKAKHECVRVVM